MTPAATVVPPARLHAVARELLEAAGATAANAECVAEALVGANLAGHDSHGVMKLPSYVRDIKRGNLKPAAEPFVVSEGPSTASVDGGATFGQVGALLSVGLVVAKASEHGAAAVALSHAHHTGRIGEWTERIAAAGLVGMAAGGEAQPPYMLAPYGGARGALATNPVSWAIPRRDGLPPILLDYATSAVAIGKLQVAHARGDPIPDGWIVDQSGAPSGDVQDFFDGGFLVPFGLHKGYALAVVAEFLSVGLAAGDRFTGIERSSCLFFLALDPERFRSRSGFDALVDATVERLKAVEPAEGFAEVLVPGEPETRKRAERRNGIPIPRPTWDAIVTIAAELGVELD